MNTFHGMGIVSMSLRIRHDIDGSFPETVVPRLKCLNVSEVVKNKGIPLLSYNLPEKSALSTLKFKPLSSLQFTSASPLL